MKNFTISLFIFIISLVINTTFATNIISQFLANSPLNPDRALYPQQQPQSQIPVQPSSNKNNAFFHIDENVVLKKNDMLTCKVVNSKEDKNGAEFKVNTPPLSGSTIFYTYLPVVPGETCFSVKIRAEKYAYLALSENPFKGGRMFDIILGITGPITHSGIRKNLAEEVVKVPTQGILNGKEFREFEISWKNGQIMVMRASDSTPFMYYVEPNMYPVNYIGIATFDKPGTWIVSDKGCQHMQKPVDSENFVTECWLQPKTEKKSQFNNLIELQKYFLKQMMNDYEHFNTSSNQQNDKEFIEIYKNELKENYNKVKEIHNEIILNQIKSDGKEELNHETEIIFEEIRKLFYQQYGNLQILLNKLTNSNNFMNGNLDSKCNENVKKPNHESENIKSISKDEFYEITTTGCFTFKVHKSAGYIRITLTNGHKKSLKALIIIGETSEIQTWKDFKNFENLKLATPIFKIRGEYQSYWLSWNAQRILVGPSGEMEGFMNTNIAMDFTDLKYVNFVTENEGEKQWEIEESQCPHDIDIRIDE